MQISKSVKDTGKIATDFAKSITVKEKFSNDKAVVVCLYGELGTGKTTFTKYLAKALGVEEVIQSPTFVIEKIYPVKLREADSDKVAISQGKFSHLIHIDAYRLESGEEIQKLGWDEIISNPKNLIIVEWPENIKEVLPKERINIYFEHISEEERKISINL